MPSGVVVVYVVHLEEGDVEHWLHWKVRREVQVVGEMTHPLHDPERSIISWD